MPPLQQQPEGAHQRRRATGLGAAPGALTSTPVSLAKEARSQPAGSPLLSFSLKGYR